MWADAFQGMWWAAVQLDLCCGASVRKPGRMGGGEQGAAESAVVRGETAVPSGSGICFADEGSVKVSKIGIRVDEPGTGSDAVPTAQAVCPLLQGPDAIWRGPSLEILSLGQVRGPAPSKRHAWTFSAGRGSRTTLLDACFRSLGETGRGGRLPA